MLITHAVAVLFALQQPQQQAAPTLPPSPVTRIEITPRTRNIVAGDSIKLDLYCPRRFASPTDTASHFSCLLKSAC